MTTNTKIATNTTNANAALDKYALAIAIMSNTPEICGAYYLEGQSMRDSLPCTSGENN